MVLIHGALHQCPTCNGHRPLRPRSFMLPPLAKQIAGEVITLADLVEKINFCKTTFITSYVDIVRKCEISIIYQCV